MGGGVGVAGGRGVGVGGGGSFYHYSDNAAQVQTASIRQKASEGGAALTVTYDVLPVPDNRVCR